jgi:pimeloyl-ACP methyl ester carboxylesterase
MGMQPLEADFPGAPRRLYVSFRIACIATLLVLVGCANNENSVPADQSSSAGGQAGSGITGNSSQGGGSGNAGNAGNTGQAGNAGSSSSVAWGSCPEGFQTECARIPVPLDWNNPTGKTIEVLVSRRLSGVEGAPQIWLLMGGPGGSADGFNRGITTMADNLAPMDIYTLEHRGAGESGMLHCPDQESETSSARSWITANEIPGCIAYLKKTYGDELAHYTTSNAAKDVQEAIKQANNPQNPIFVYGISYGTFWAHRYLQLSGDQATGVILDSIVPPGAHLSDFGKQWDPVAKDFFERCANDELCSSKLGSDPWGFIQELFAKLKKGHCANLGWGVVGVRSVISSMLSYGVFYRNLIPPIVYRINRCESQDVNVLNSFALSLSNAGSGMKSRAVANVLSYHIALSELWPTPPPDVQTLEKEYNASFFGSFYAKDAGAGAGQWPSYHDDLSEQWAQTDKPMLMLNGTLDPQTTMAMALSAKDHFYKKNQTFITVPGSAHGVLFQSYMKDAGSVTCGMKLIEQFVQNPKATIDQSCLTEMIPDQFQGFESIVSKLWPGNDLYENQPSSSSPAPVPMPPQAWEKLGEQETPWPWQTSVMAR